MMYVMSTTQQMSLLLDCFGIDKLFCIQPPTVHLSVGMQNSTFYTSYGVRTFYTNGISYLYHTHTCLMVSSFHSIGLLGYTMINIIFFWRIHFLKICSQFSVRGHILFEVQWLIRCARMVRLILSQDCCVSLVCIILFVAFFVVG